MLLTNQFVYVHMPKTGGTFVTEILSRVHARRGRPRMLPTRAWRLLQRLGVGQSRYGPLIDQEPKHGTCRDIPQEQRSKAILSSMRNPFDWYVSQYEFGWWKRTFMYHPVTHPTPVGYAIEQVLPEFQRRLPHFPEISFAEFIGLCDLAASHYNLQHRPQLGLFTHGFLQYYSADPAGLLAEMNEERIQSGEYRARLLDVHFLITERVNSDLRDYLLSMGYADEDIEFIQDQGRILPMGRGRRDDQKWEQYYTPALHSHVRLQDRLLLAMFPELDTPMTVVPASP